MSEGKILEDLVVEFKKGVIDFLRLTQEMFISLLDKMSSEKQPAVTCEKALKLIHQ